MKKILIIDDERSIRNTFRIFMENAGYRVMTADNVDDAFKIINNEKFDLIITDCIMPKTSGLELLKKLRINDNLTPVIVMTGEPTSENQALAFEVKASAYLAKPISKATLLESVNSIFNIN